MRFVPPLVHGRLVRRYKRFLADVTLEDGALVTAHCTNTGALLGCLREGAPVLLARVDNPARKLPWTWKMVRVGRTWVVVDTATAVPLVREALDRGLLPELAGHERVLTEVPYGTDRASRIDILLSSGGTPVPTRGRRTLFEGDRRIYVEVKSTTLAWTEDGARIGAFPDAVTERGQKHLRELVSMVEQGHRAAMVFCSQRSDCQAFRSADAIDPEYGRLLREAVAAGVEAYALSVTAGPTRIHPLRRLPIQL